MASEFLIPHPNIPTADIGLPKLKEVTVKNNENFLALDRLLREFNSGMSALDRKIDATAHDHPYAPEEHQHELADVNGLIAALDMKAPSVHTHEQYLTSVPTHSHAQAEVDGLLAELAGKADQQHRHNLGDVDALQESLSGKADNAYVKWLESQMAKLTQSDTPLVDGDPESGAGVIGTSEKAARADHQHPVNKTSDVNKLVHDGNGTGGTPQIGTLYSYALTDHSHPLNYPTGKPTNVLAPDGNGTGDTPQFGESNYYADLYHSHPLNVGKSGTPSDVVKNNGTASLGSSGYYARQDHVHKMPQIEQNDVNGLTDDLDSLDDRVSALEDKPAPSGFVKSVLGSTGADGAVGTEILGTSADKAAYGNHKHGNLTTDGKVGTANGNLVATGTGGAIGASSLSLAKITGHTDVQALQDMAGVFTEKNGSLRVPTTKLSFDSDSEHEGLCLLKIDGNGDVHHSGNAAYNSLKAITSNGSASDGAVVAYSGTGDGATYEGLTRKAFGGDGTTSAKTVVFEENGAFATLKEGSSATEDGTGTEGDIPMFCEGGVLTASGISIPSDAPDADKVLTAKKDGTFAWEDKGGENPQTDTPFFKQSTWSYDDNAKVDSTIEFADDRFRRETGNMWSRGTAATGFKIQVVSRTERGTEGRDVIYFRDAYVDKFGGIYKVGDESHAIVAYRYY